MTESDARQPEPAPSDAMLRGSQYWSALILSLFLLLDGGLIFAIGSRHRMEKNLDEHPSDLIWTWMARPIALVAAAAAFAGFAALDRAGRWRISARNLAMAAAVLNLALAGIGLAVVRDAASWGGGEYSGLNTLAAIAFAVIPPLAAAGLAIGNWFALGGRRKADVS